MVKNLFTEQQWKNRHRDTFVNMGRGEERVRCMESNMETSITMCKIDSQREFAICLMKLKQGLCINLEGWDEEGGGREVQKGGAVCIPMDSSC